MENEQLNQKVANCCKKDDLLKQLETLLQIKREIVDACKLHDFEFTISNIKNDPILKFSSKIDVITGITLETVLQIIRKHKDYIWWISSLSSDSCRAYILISYKD